MTSLALTTRHLKQVHLIVGKSVTTVLIFTASMMISSGCGNKKESNQESSTSEFHQNETMDFNQVKEFAGRYAKAWCSHNPESVAAFFAEQGSLSVNNDTPAVGRIAIAAVAKGFMTDFPDMIVTMDSLKMQPDGIEFHWTLSGTNSGPGGSGKKVRINGFELWTMDEDGLISKSQGSFDAEEYRRQVEFGVGP